MTESPLTRQGNAQAGVAVLPRQRRVFGWAFVGQGFSSASNFALTVLAGRLLGPRQLGVIVIGFAAYQLVAGLQRAIVTQPVVAHASPLPRAERELFARSVLTVNLVSGAIAAALMSLVGLAVGGHVGRGLLLFAPWVLIGLLQEFWKTILFQEGRGAAGAASDCVRFAVMLAALPVATAWEQDYVVVGLWGAGATVGLAVATVRLPLLPERLRSAAAAWRKRAWGLGRWLGAREVVYQLLTYTMVLLLAAIIGTRNLGGLRSAEALFSPFSLIAAALVLPSLPLLSRAASVSHVQARRLAFRISGLAVAFGLAYFALMALLGPWLLVTLFGHSFSPFKSLVWPMAAAQVFLAAGSSFTILLSAERRGRASFAAGVVGAAATVACAAALAAVFGVKGAAWGMAAGAAVASVTVVYLAVARRPREAGAL
jgi:O-antigen/teichoic acid export membrane protein